MPIGSLHRDGDIEVLFVLRIQDYYRLPLSLNLAVIDVGFDLKCLQ